MGNTTQKDELLGNCAPEYKMDAISLEDVKKMFPTREKAFRIASSKTNFKNFDDDGEGNMSDLAQERISRTARRLFKVASDDDTLKGALVGGATGAGIGLAATGVAGSIAGRKVGKAIDSLGIDFLSKHVKPLVRKGITNGAMNVPLRPDLFLKDKSLLTSGEKLLKKLPVSGAVAGGLGLIGAAAGAMTGKALSKRNSSQYQNYDPYAGSYGGYKYASDEHAFITETNIDPLPAHALPDDIDDAVQLAHPALKYMPLVSGIGALGAGALAKALITRRTPNLHDLLLHGFLGTIGGAIAKKHLSEKYSEPYMKTYARDIEHKYKTASENEYISETGIPVIERKNFPKSLESMITYHHPIADMIPTISTAAGMILGRGLTHSTSGLVAGAALGGMTGTVGRMLLIDKLIDPYRKKYIEEVNKRYDVS
jgi:hypothetical protein